MAAHSICADIGERTQSWEPTRPTVFAYNLMNEPLATGAKQASGQWTHPTALHGQTYIEYINLDPAGRKPSEIAQAWIRQMIAAIRRHDQRHLITVGLI